MAMVPRTTVFFILASSIAFPTSSYFQKSYDERDKHHSSWLVSPASNIDDFIDTKRLTEQAGSSGPTMMTGTREIRRRQGTTLHSKEKDFDFFDQLYNSIAGSLQPPLSNRTAVKYNSSEGSINYTLCHLSAFLNFHANSSYIEPSIDGIRSVASALMALLDFNTGNNSIIPQIRQCNTDKFNLRFTMELIDTRRQPLTASTELVKILNRKRHPIKHTEGNIVQAYPSGIIGAVRSAVTSPLSKLAGVNDLVTISHASSSNDFSSEIDYPFFGRTIPAARVDAMSIISYFRDILDATHLGVLYVNDNFGVSYARSIQRVANHGNSSISVASISLPVNSTKDEAIRSLRILDRTGYRYIVGIFSEEEFETVMPLAHDMGIAGEDYFWMFTEPQKGLINSPLGARSDIARAMRGSAILGTPTELLQGTPFYNAYMSRFSELWSSEEGWSYLQSKLPGLNLKKDLIEESRPSIREMFLYEAVVALCLASCDAAESTSSDFYTASELYEFFTHTTFDGVYGPTSFDHKTGDRSPDSVQYAVYNILSIESNLTIEVNYPLVLQRENNPWESFHNREFIYADGTTTPPDNLPPLEIYGSGISNETAAISMALCFTILALSVIFIVWTYRQRNTRVVCAAQPFFLYILCAGTLMMGSSLIPTSLLAFDSSQKSMNAMCTSTIWLFSIGFIISFSALFSKTMRIHKVMAKGRQHKRIVVRPMDVMRPFLILLTIALIILITATILAPWDYTYYPIETSVDRFGRVNIFYGECTFADDKIIAGSILYGLSALIDMIVVFLSAYYAFRARSLPTSYNESFYIFITLYILLQTQFVAIPMDIVSLVNPSSHLLMESLNVFLICLAILLPMFGPKIISLREERKEELEKEKKKKERLERLQKFDALKKEHEDDVSVISTGSKAPTLSDEQVEAHKEYGMEIFSLPKAQVYKSMIVDLSKVQSENVKLKQSIKTKLGKIFNAERTEKIYR